MQEKSIKLLFLFIFLFFISGCISTTSNNPENNIKKVFNTSQTENIKDAATALESVSEAITGKELTDDQARKLANDLRKDKDTQTAVKKITDSLEGKKIDIKYCPTDGKRYSSGMEYCPGTDIKLLPVE